MVRGRPRLKPFVFLSHSFPGRGASFPRMFWAALGVILSPPPSNICGKQSFLNFFYPEQIGANFALVGSGIQNVLTRIRNTLILQVPYCSLYLMGPTDEVEVVSVEELAHHVRPKGEADPTIILTPALNILVRVRPQQVTQQS